MKTKAMHFTAFGNMSLVQLSSGPLTSFPFSPAGPAIRSGGLVISEVTAMGSVGQLAALSKTADYLLLTDADILIGAKQNRIVNRSVLLAPAGKTIIDVSCVERLRWDYRSSSFSTPGSVADPDLRGRKAGIFASMKTDTDMPSPDAQGMVWDHVSRNLVSEGHASPTESYSELLRFRLAKAETAFPDCNPEQGCNGLAVLLDGKVITADLFGNEESYRYYFPMLRDAAFTMARSAGEEKQTGIHEAYFKVLEAIDEFSDAGRRTDEAYPGAGTLHMIESVSLAGFSLMHNEEMIHNAFFARQD